MVHKPKLWVEIQKVIKSVDANSCKNKVSKEKTKKEKILFFPTEMNTAMKIEFSKHGWEESKTYYWVTKDSKLIRKTMQFSKEEQKKEIESAGATPILSYKQTDFVKERTAVEVQFSKYSFVAYDLFVKHMAFL